MARKYKLTISIRSSLIAFTNLLLLTQALTQISSEPTSSLLTANQYSKALPIDGDVKIIDTDNKFIKNKKRI